MKFTRFLTLYSVCHEPQKLLRQAHHALNVFSLFAQTKIRRTFLTHAARQVKTIQCLGLRQDHSSKYLFKRTNLTSTLRNLSGFSGWIGTVYGKDKISIHLGHTQWLGYLNPCIFYSTKLSKMANVSAILKNHSALQVTKPARKKAPKISELGKVSTSGHVYCEYELSSVKDKFY